MGLLGVLLVGCQTATLLSDGRVLLVAADRAIVCNPVSGTLEPAGAPSTPRIAHAATLLADGRVLVTRGIAGIGPTQSAGLFDPDTASFSATGSLLEGRSFHTATLLDDGDVLVVGGGELSMDSESATVPPLATAERWDVETGEFSATGPLSTGRVMHSATLLGDGSVLVVGGSSDGAAALASTERYDPQAGTFQPAGSLATGRALHAVVPMPDGGILLIGGVSGVSSGQGVPVDSVERYDPSAGTFSAAGSLSTPRGGHTATLLRDGRILVAGGMSQTGEGVTSAELLDPATGTATPTGDMAEPRGLHSATLLPSGDVLIVGGGSIYLTAQDADPLGTPEVYEVASGTFRALTP